MACHGIASNTKSDTSGTVGRLKEVIQLPSTPANLITPGNYSKT